MPNGLPVTSARYYYSKLFQDILWILFSFFWTVFKVYEPVLRFEEFNRYYLKWLKGLVCYQQLAARKNIIKLDWN